MLIVDPLHQNIDTPAADLDYLFTHPSAPRSPSSPPGWSTQTTISSASSTLPSTGPSCPQSPRPDFHFPLSFRDSAKRARRLPRSPRDSSSGLPPLLLLLLLLALALLLDSPLPLEAAFGGISVACDLGMLLRELAADLSLGVERGVWDWEVAGEGGWESVRDVGVGGAIPSVAAVLLGREGVSPDK